MATATHLTADALFEMDWPEDGTGYELSDGELVIVGVGGVRHELANSRFASALFGWSSEHPNTVVLVKALIKFGEHIARLPDIAVLLPGRLALIPEDNSMISVVPNLAVDVISQSDFAADAERKVRQYLAAGVEEVWQVYTDQRFIRVRQPHSIKDFDQNETLASRVLIGFKVQAKSFFFG